MTFPKIRRSVLVGLMVAGSPWGSSAALAQDVAKVQPEPTETSPGEDTVVTASKRVERMQDSAVQVSVLSGDRIQTLGIDGFADFARYAPNVNLAGGGAASGAPGIGVVVIRGINSGNGQTTATTATYLGETPFTANGSISLSSYLNPDPDLIEVQRVEIDKGPQGTLFGASSLGGLVRIIPKEPDPKGLFGSFRPDETAIDGGGVGGGVRGTVNVPLASNAALLVTGFAKYDPGFTRNVATSRPSRQNHR